VGFTGAKLGKKGENRASRGWPRIGDGWGPGGCSLTESAAQAWVSSALFAFVCRVCDRTLRPFPVGGPFPCQQLYCFNPARPSTARLAGEMPPLREGDRYFFGAAPSQRSDCSLPSSRFTTHEPVSWL